MPILKPYKTIPELYEFLTEEYGVNMERPVLKHKVNNQWVGISYVQLKEETENLAYGLQSLGVKAGDKVSIVAENRPEWVYADMAILGLGAVDVPLYPSLTSDSIEFILNNSESLGVIVSNKFQLNKILKIRGNCRTLKFIIVMNEKDSPNENSIYSLSSIQEKGAEAKKQNPQLFKEQRNRIKENDICTIIYTSGTTGEPKGVLLTHKNIVSNVLDALKAFPIGPDDIFLSFLPLCHIFERMAGYYTAFSAGAMICYATSIESVAGDLMEIHPTIVTSVPRLFERIYSKVIKNVESQPAKKQKIF
ncbi:MAG: AMP-binding protein, partial [Ignavibacteria bacterium]|nr:AMP-binding protein [Ignavibacteria bacterium]